MSRNRKQETGNRKQETGNRKQVIPIPKIYFELFNPFHPHLKCTHLKMKNKRSYWQQCNYVSNYTRIVLFEKYDFYSANTYNLPKDFTWDGKSVENEMRRKTLIEINKVIKQTWEK